MSYVRLIPAVRINQIDTHEEDYETEFAHHQITDNLEGKWRIAPDHNLAFLRIRWKKASSATPRDRGRDIATLRYDQKESTWYQAVPWTVTKRLREYDLLPLMLHFAVNRPVGATRGEGDLTTVLPWARRYSEWLKDRVRLNRQRTRNGLLDIEIADNTLVEAKRAQLRNTNPIEAGIYVHGPGEKVTLHDLQINADDAKEDGRTLRLACATGANVALHFLGEGEAVNYATAKEMGEPTARFYSDRQTEMCNFLVDLVTAAWWRHQAALGQTVKPTDNLQLTVHTTEVARADNESLASAARDIAEALRVMKEQGWITDEQAIRLAFKFAGEVIGEDDVKEILESSHAPQTEEDK